MATTVVIAPNAVRMPVGRILLIRKGREECAVKPTALEANRRGGHNMAYASFSYRPEASGSRTMRARTDTASTRQPIGTGHILTLTDAGRDSLVYFYMWDTDVGSRVELAPTKWTVAADVDFGRMDLVWYRFDENRKDWELPVERLP